MENKIKKVKVISIDERCGNIVNIGDELEIIREKRDEYMVHIPKQNTFCFIWKSNVEIIGDD